MTIGLALFFSRVAVIAAMCILLGLVGDVTAEKIIVEDNFPGFEEDPDWDNSWTTGIGSLSYYVTSPGFARLLLDGPGVGDTYHNSEKKHYRITARMPPYCTFEVRLRNSNHNGWDAPGAPDTPDPTYGLGSRGWGLWNDQMLSSNATVIWFISISPESTSLFRGTRIWIIHEGTPVLMQDLGIDLTKWHIYRIQWRHNYIGVFIDDMTSPIAEVTDPNDIPDEGLNFTVWTDNYVLSGDFANPIFNYLAVPDIDQYIDVDYVKIFVPNVLVSTPGGDSSGCFIATAAYGTPMERCVKVLREFRDKFLLTSRIGMMCVQLYYICSPSIANSIATHDALRGIVYRCLLPLVGVSWAALRLNSSSMLVRIILLPAAITITVSPFVGKIKKWT